MAEPNILLTRIDNRLIHGQVATQWNSTLGSNLILVANDEVSTNTMRQNLMKMAAPTGVQTRFFSIQKTIDVIHKASPAQKIFIVLDSPQDALKLVEGGDEGLGHIAATELAPIRSLMFAERGRFGCFHLCSCLY